MRRLAILVMLFAVTPSFTQSYPEVDALCEVAFAEDAATVMRHLPVSLQESVDELPANEQAAFAETLMAARLMREEGVVLQRSTEGQTILRYRDKDSPKDSVLNLKRRISDGHGRYCSCACSPMDS
jgi:hypothetical protein